MMDLLSTQSLPLIEALIRLQMAVSWAGPPRNEYAIFGSTSLILRGILDREPGDIDVLVSRQIWGRTFSELEDWHIETPKAGDPPILVNGASPIPIHMFYDWSDVDLSMDVPKLIRTAETVDLPRGVRFRCISVEEALRHKKCALQSGTLKVQKHIPDIAIIEDYLRNRA